MRVCHIGNMANDGYATVSALRSVGVDAELMINASDFGMGLPHWEIYDVKADPYKKVDLDALPPLPEWIKTYDLGGRRNIVYSLTEVLRAVRREGYDFLHLHFPMGQYLQFSGIPYGIYEAGFLRHVVEHGDSWAWTRLGKRAYANAEVVTWTNTDMGPMIAGQRTKREVFVPFAIDTERYKPVPHEDRDVLRFLHPARQCWDVKGNDRMIRAFVRYIESGGRAHLTLVDWGYAEDVAEAKRLLAPVGEWVSWVPPMNKPRLIEAYQSSDAVLDQFLIGGSGTTGYEVMSCGVPLMIYFKSVAECYGEEPPCVNAESEEQVLEGFRALEDAKLRHKLGIRGRSFVERHLSYRKVGEQLRGIYEEAVS